jgi:hypothetical protein
MWLLCLTHKFYLHEVKALCHICCTNSRLVSAQCRYQISESLSHKDQQELREGLTCQLLLWVVCKVGISKDIFF